MKTDKAKPEVKPEVKPDPVEIVPEPVSGCVVCGGTTGTFVSVAGAARAHAECADARPDVIRKVKARA